MKNILVLVLAFAANFSFVSKAAAFATHDMPPAKVILVASATPKAYGAPVKLDLSYNRCVERGQDDYKTTLFYEEFDSMSECLKSKDRG